MIAFITDAYEAVSFVKAQKELGDCRQGSKSLSQYREGFTEIVEAVQFNNGDIPISENLLRLVADTPGAENKHSGDPPDLPETVDNIKNNGRVVLEYVQEIELYIVEKEGYERELEHVPNEYPGCISGTRSLQTTRTFPSTKQ